MQAATKYAKQNACADHATSISSGSVLIKALNAFTFVSVWWGQLQLTV
jgi:hypothetical protein